MKTVADTRRITLARRLACNLPAWAVARASGMSTGCRRSSAGGDLRPAAQGDGEAVRRAGERGRTRAGQAAVTRRIEKGAQGTVRRVAGAGPATAWRWLVRYCYFQPQRSAIFATSALLAA